MVLVAKLKLQSEMSSYFERKKKKIKRNEMIEQDKSNQLSQFSSG